MLKHLARALLAILLLAAPAEAASTSSGGAPGATAAGQAAANGVFGTCTEAAYTGSGTPTICSLLKALYGQAAPTSVPGTSLGSAVGVPGFQGVLNGVPLTITGSVTTTSSNALASPSYRIPVAAAGTNATNFFVGAKKVFHARFCNVSTSFRSFKLYDKASTPTVGTDVPVATIPAPAGACPVVDWTSGFPFSLGVAVAITGGAADTDTTAIAAGDVVGLNIDHN